MSVTGLLAEIAEVGRHRDSGGYRRFAFTADDAVLGEWFAAVATGLGGDVTVDRCGNQWAWWGDPDTALASGTSGVVTGSHLDSVPDGGPMDGPLGVAAALVAVRALRDNGTLDDVTAGRNRPLGVVRFVDEEGARFGLACSGSRLLTGTSEPAAVLALQDAGGTSYGEAARAAGIAPDHLGRDDETLCRVGHFVELHVEQGRALATPELDAAIGVASRIRPHGRFRLDLMGKADHAGTTLLADRDDPMLALATVVQVARAAAAEHGALATVGKVDVRPNAVNAIPSSVRAWLDLRADTEEQVRATLADVEAAIGQGAVQESWTGATEFPTNLARELAETVGVELGTGPVPILPTGAGHDAGVLAQAGVPSSMLFVRNPTGVSHAPDEHAEPDDCETGAAALTAVLTRLLSPR
ncbi:MAG: allantoate amidohydrolase [Kineosporiaceae bacterium]|nr:allantoate amidohydrolase [Kineosporiaceae bacterium]